MKKFRLAACSAALLVGGLGSLGALPAAAETASSAAAVGYGLNTTALGVPVLDRVGLATATLPPGEDDGPNSLLAVPVEPVLVSATGVGEANAHAASDIPSALTDATQAVAGPYNVRGVGLVEGLDVGLGVAGAAAVPLLSVALARGEAVGVCRAGTPVYSANSEIVALNVAGTTVPLTGTVTDLLGIVTDLLEPVAQVADIELNDVTVSASGASVTALRVTLLGLLGEPLLNLEAGHAEVGGLQCAPEPPECSDTVDNADPEDTLVDAQDPGCITNGVYDPNDDDERNECIDEVDNADPEDTLADFGSDPGCESIQDDDERNGPLPRTTAAELPRTGGEDSTTLPVAGGLALLALGALALRRRSQTAG